MYILAAELSRRSQRRADVVAARRRPTRSPRVRRCEAALAPRRRRLWIALALAVQQLGDLSRDLVGSDGKGRVEMNISLRDAARGVSEQGPKGADRTHPRPSCRREWHADPPMGRRPRRRRRAQPTDRAYPKGRPQAGKQLG